MLTSAARETLRGVEAVIIDEIHALAATKRGSHLAVTLERLDHWVRAGRRRRRRSASGCPPRSGRWRRSPGSSAAPTVGDDGERRPRPVTVVDAGVRKPLEIEVVIPVDDMAELGTVIDEPTSGPGRGRPGPPLDLAGHAPAAARAGEGEPLHADLRERPPAGGAAGHPAQRAALGGREPRRPRPRAPRPCTRSW